MNHLNLGDGLRVSAIGLGAMGMTAFYGPTNEQESIATLRRHVSRIAEQAVAQEGGAA